MFFMRGRSRGSNLVGNLHDARTHLVWSRKRVARCDDVVPSSPAEEEVLVCCRYPTYVWYGFGNKDDIS